MDRCKIKWLKPLECFIVLTFSSTKPNWSDTQTLFTVQINNIGISCGIFQYGWRSVALQGPPRWVRKAAWGPRQVRNLRSPSALCTSGNLSSWWNIWPVRTEKTLSKLPKCGLCWCRGERTHWAGQRASNRLWSCWQAAALSWFRSRHFHSSSLASQHAFLSAEFGAAIAASERFECWTRDKVNFHGFYLFYLSYLRELSSLGNTHHRRWTLRK